jgi:predicted dehydrogenase
MTPRSVRVGVIGVGHLGGHHARNYSRLSGVELTGVHDRDQGRAQTIAAELGCASFATRSELAARVDALSIAVPAAIHAEVAIPCLENGIAVLIEKPMATSVAEAEAIRAAALKNGVPLMVGHVERWNGAFRRVRHLIHEPRFIEGHRLSSFVGRGLDVDVIFDLMIHDLDLVSALSRAPIRQVAAIGVPVLTQSVDIANVRLEFDDGLVANLTASRVSREPMRKLRIFQADAYVSIDFAARSAEVVTRRKGTRTPAGPGISTRSGGLADLPTGQIESGLLEAKVGPAELNALLAGLKHQTIDAGEEPEPLAAELGAFVEAVRTGRVPGPGAEEGLEAVKLAENVTRKIAASMAATPIGARQGADPDASP